MRVPAAPFSKVVWAVYRCIVKTPNCQWLTTANGAPRAWTSPPGPPTGKSRAGGAVEEAREACRTRDDSRREAVGRAEVCSGSSARPTLKRRRRSCTMASTSRVRAPTRSGEVGIALAAVDLMLGTFDLRGRRAASTLILGARSRLSTTGKENTAGKAKGAQTKKRVKSLRDDFFKWSKGRAGDARHTFQDVPVPDKDALRFSNQMQETMEEYARSYNHNERIPEDERNTYILSSLAYTPPLGRKPKNGFEELMLNQGKILNKMWMKRLIAGWKSCQKEVVRKKRRPWRPRVRRPWMTQIMSQKRRS